jgi:hypothetical protein
VESPPERRAGGHRRPARHHPRRPAREIVATAEAEFPTFAEDLDELCR